MAASVYNPDTMNSKIQQPFITSKQYAERHGLSHSHVKQKIRQGKIPRAKKVGRDWIIFTSEEAFEAKGPVTAKVVADKLGFSESHIRRLIREGKINGVKLGRDWIITDLEQRLFKKTKKRKK